MDTRLLYLVLVAVLVLPVSGGLSWALNARWARAGWVALGASLLSWVGSLLAWLLVALGGGLQMKLHTWQAPGGFHLDVGVVVDAAGTAMLALVTTVLVVVHLFAAGTDHAWNGRRAALPNVLVFCLAILFLADGYIPLLLGWEGTAACVYAMLSSHPGVPSSGVHRALVIHRIGATCLLAACVVTVMECGAAAYPGALTGPGRDWVAVLVAVAAASFAGVLPLHLWLSGVELAPAPTSGLLQGAVASAGLFLLIRAQPVFAHSPVAADLLLVAGLGAGLLMALVSLTTRDLARALTCSTASQAGLITAAVGLGCTSVASSQVFVHGLAKCGLVLAAGRVLQTAPHRGRLDRLGGLRSHLPLAFWVFAISSATLAGVPPLAALWSHGQLLQACGATVAPALALGGLIVVNAMYLTRLTVLTFMGKSSSTALSSPELPQPAAAAAALVTLAVLTPLSVAILGAANGNLPTQMPALLGAMSPDRIWVEGRPWAAAAGLSAVGGLITWIYIRRRSAPVTEAGHGESAARALMDRAYRLDEAGDLLVARPLRAAGRATWTFVDTMLLDVLLARGLPLLARGLAWGVDWLHRGCWRRSALVLVLGAAGGLLALLLMGT